MTVQSAMTETPLYLSRADGMSNEYVAYARKLATMSYQTLCGRQLHVLSVPAYKPWADEEHRALFAERARFSELANELAQTVLPDLGLDPEALREEAESALAAGRKLRLTAIPLEHWTDGVVFHYLYTVVLAGQLPALIGSNYIPYANWAQKLYFSCCLVRWPGPVGSPILPRLRRAVAEDGAASVQACVAKWWPHAISSFGAPGSANEQAYLRLGLKIRPNAMCREMFLNIVQPDFAELGLKLGALP
ncbi:MAG: Phenylacetic acid catabolic protein [Candidatus Binatia bacterium]